LPKLDGEAEIIRGFRRPGGRDFGRGRSVKRLIDLACVENLREIFEFIEALGFALRVERAIPSRRGRARIRKTRRADSYFSSRPLRAHQFLSEILELIIRSEFYKFNRCGGFETLDAFRFTIAESPLTAVPHDSW